MGVTVVGRPCNNDSHTWGVDGGKHTRLEWRFVALKGRELEGSTDCLNSVVSHPDCLDWAHQRTALCVCVWVRRCISGISPRLCLGGTSQRSWGFLGGWVGGFGGGGWFTQNKILQIFGRPGVCSQLLWMPCDLDSPWHDATSPLFYLIPPSLPHRPFHLEMFQSGQERGASPTRPFTAYGFNFWARRNISFFPLIPPQPTLLISLKSSGPPGREWGAGRGCFRGNLVMSAHSPASRCFISFLLALLLCIVACETCYREILFFFILETQRALLSPPRFHPGISSPTPPPPKPLAGLVFANPAASLPHVVHFGIINH